MQAIQKKVCKTWLTFVCCSAGWLLLRMYAANTEQRLLQ
jgi:hypothetical protein